MAAGLSFGVLGPFDVRRDGEPLDLGGPQPRAVLAHLVLDAGRVVAADRLIERLWGDEPPASALGTLQSYVSRVRRALEPDRAPGAPARLLVSEAPGYVLRVPRESVDLFRAEALTAAARAAAERRDALAALDGFDAALALWRGPALGGVARGPALDAAVARLEEDRLGLVEDRFDALLALGRHAAVVGDLQEAVTEHPLRERLWGQLALALYRSHRQADALRALASARTTLAEELGLDPGPELRRLEAQILAHDPALVATAAPAARPEQSAPGPVVPAVAPLVGRAPEWEALLATFDLVAAGTSRLVLIAGEAGIGKTALLAEVDAEAARRGWAAVTGRGVEGGLAPALWPWIEALRAVLSRAPEAALTGRLTLAELVAPAASERPPLTASLVPLADEVAELLGEVGAATPLVVVLDDLHWADMASLDLLALVAGRLGASRVLLAGAHRPPDLEDAGPLAATLGALARVPGTARLTLAGLGVDDVAVLMHSITGRQPNPEVVQRVHDRSGGNPLFVSELARLPDTGFVPDAVRDVVRRRLAHLPERTLDLLVVAAVLGEEIDLHVLPGASGRDPDTCLDDLDPAVVTRVLVPTDAGRYRFGHALVREAVLADLSPLRLARLHVRAADAIEATYGTDRDHAEPIAAHRWAAAGVEQPLRLVDALTRAGDVARRRGAFDAAEDLLTRALDACRRLPTGAAREDREIEALEQLLTIDSVRHFMSEDLDGRAARIDEVARANDSDAARTLATFVRWSVVNQSRFAETEAITAAALAAAEHSRTPYVQLLAHYMAGVQCWATGRIPRACRHFEVALGVRDGAQEAEVPVRLPGVDLAGLAALAFELAGDHDRADALVLDNLERLGRRATPQAVVDTSFMAALVHAIRGDAPTAGTWAARALGSDGTVEVSHYTPASRVVWGWSRAMADAMSGACAAIAESLEELDRGATTIVVPMLRSLHGEALLATGAPAAALEALARAERDARSTGETFWLPETLRLLAQARQVFGAPAGEVDALLAEALDLAQRQGEPALAARIRASRTGG